MNTVLYFSPGGRVYETCAYTRADIAGLVENYGLDSLTSTDRQFDFWFTPSTRQCKRKVNRSATEMLLATTGFKAKNVPLLHGGVVLATHDSDGDLDGLSWHQLDRLITLSSTITRRDDRVLNRRIGHDERRQQHDHATETVPVPIRAGQQHAARH